MDINVLGTQYQNSAYVPFSSMSDQPASALQAGRDSSFEDVLKRTQAAKASLASGEIASSRFLKDADIDKTSKLYEVCMELETFLIKNLIKSMRGTVQKSKLIDTGFAGEIYEDMLYDEYTKDFAKNAGFGFAEMAYRELAGLR